MSAADAPFSFEKEHRMSKKKMRRDRALMEIPRLRANRRSGIMLTALGAFNREAQEFSLASGEKVHLFEVIPLCPMEVAYRSSHHALDLLELFKNKRLVISPLTEGRPDAVAELNKINA